MTTRQPQGGSGPFVNAFLLCNRLDGQQQAITAIHGVIDQAAVPGNTPQMSAGQMGAPFYVAFHTGGGRRDYTVSIECDDPAGQTTTLYMDTIQASAGEGGGATVAGQLVIPLTVPGVYWLHLVLNGTRAARTPLTVHYRRVP